MNGKGEDKDSILRDIRDGVWLIAAAMAEPLRKRLATEFLTSPQRKRMYSEFDGTQSYETVSKKVGVTAEAVRQFSVALQKEGFVVFIKDGARTCPRKLL
jgi:hypothetical protein